MNITLRNKTFHLLLRFGISYSIKEAYKDTIFQLITSCQGFGFHSLLGLPLSLNNITARIYEGVHAYILYSQNYVIHIFLHPFSYVPFRINPYKILFTDQTINTQFSDTAQ